jgi:proteasome lid subunit RPN8/RPN11
MEGTRAAVLHLTSDHAAMLFDHAQQTYPDECCGLLIGITTPDGQRSLLEVIPTRNAWDMDAAEQMANAQPSLVVDRQQDKRSRRYWIDPHDLLQAQRYARTLTHRDGTPNLIGIYHSHPDHPARPSECDRLCAWPDYSYIIVSVHHGVPQDLLCWKLDPHHQFQAEPIVIQPKGGDRS